jgi:hypothetical protein
MMIPAVLEKAVFVAPTIILFLQGRITRITLAPAGLAAALTFMLRSGATRPFP